MGAYMSSIASLCFAKGDEIYEAYIFRVNSLAIFCAIVGAVNKGLVTSSSVAMVIGCCFIFCVFVRLFVVFVCWLVVFCARETTS